MEKNSSHTHKTGYWFLSRVVFKIPDKHPHYFSWESSLLLVRDKITATQSKVYLSTHMCPEAPDFGFEISKADRNCINVDWLTLVL